MHLEIFDSLTRQPQDLPQDEDDARVRFQHQALLRPANLDRSLQDEMERNPYLSEVFANFSFEQEVALCGAILEDTEQTQQALRGRVQERPVVAQD